MHVYTKAYSITVKIINGVEVLEEGVADEEQVLVLSGQTAFVDYEIAFLMAGFIEILLGINLKNVVTHLETDRLHFGSDVLAALLNMAEGLIRGAIEVWQSLGPFLPDFLENIWWDGKLGGSSINDSWV